MLPTIGEEAFLPRLLAHIHGEIDAAAAKQRLSTRVILDPDGNPNGLHYGDKADECEWRAHPSIFSAILLDRIVNGGGVIVDVDTYGRGDHGIKSGRRTRRVQKVAEHVETITQLIMSLHRRRIHLQPSSTPSDLTRQITQCPDVQDEISVPRCIVLSGLEKCISAVWVKLVDVLIKRHIHVQASGEAKEVRAKLPDDFTVIWVREEGMADDMPSYLVDRFSCSEPVHPSDIPPPPPSSLSIPPIPPLVLDNLSTLLPYVHIHPPLQVHISNLLSAINAHPRLSSCLTGRGVNLFTRLVQAHRLVSAPFYLPPGWEEGLEMRRRIQNGDDVELYQHAAERGLSGGKGGVGMWDVFSGAEPSVRDLTAERADDEEDSYATPVNVHGVFWTALRHRIQYREERDEVMWLLKRTAGDMLADYDTKNTPDRKKGRQVDEILTRILESV